MAHNCEHWYEALIDHALGKEGVDVESHLNDCASCRARFDDLIRIRAAGSLGSWSAPTDLVKQVQGLMAQRPRRYSVAALVRSNLGLAGVRSVAQGEVHAIFEAEDMTVRVMYVKVAEGWRVMGRASSAEWSVIAGGSRVDLSEDGSFQFTVRALEEASIDLMRWDQVVQIPPPEVVDSDESGPIG